MIQKLKNWFSDDVELEQYTIRAPFKTEDGRQYERGDTISGVLREWDNEGLADEEHDRQQMLASNTAPVYTSRDLQFNGEYVESAALVPTEWVKARNGKVLVAYGGAE